MPNLYTAIKSAMTDVTLFCQHLSGISLRSYQVTPARAILHSVINHLGLTFVIMFPRQSGKNELQAQIETYLLTLFSMLPAEIVKVSPTWKPQSLNAMRRLERVLKRNTLSTTLWRKESGYIYRFNQARIFFLSGSPTASVVGATANLLLECDEAQDIQPAKWDKDIAPMAASTNATRVFWGTAWTSRTLLARELRAAKAAEAADGVKRVFHITADDVGQEVPAYKAFVSEQIAKLGRNHPLVRSQFYSEEIDAEGGMFPVQRQSLMKGLHNPQGSPQPGKTYAFTLDIGGEDETPLSNDVGAQGIAPSKRDSTALTIAEIDFSTLADDIIHAPSYLVRHRQLWTGAKHYAIYPQLKALVDLWQPRYIVVDATGVGAGLSSFLAKAYPDKVLPFIFTSKSKSDLGWSFLAVIESGRYKEPTADPWDAVYGEYWKQVEFCQSEILEGPARLMRWSVPDGTRDPRTGELIHDDLLVSAALLSTLDAQPWGLGVSQVVPQADLFEHMKEVF